jgi:Lecithin retinol acyltransferase
MQDQAQDEINVHGVPRVGAPQFGVELEELLAGTHLIAHRRGYTHHGIYLGGGRVVHYAGRIKYPHGLVEEISLEEFSEGRALRVEALESGRFTRHEIVHRARSRLGESRYDLLKNNCEHFCNWCRLGENRSFQVEYLAAPLRLLCSALLLLFSTYRSIRGLRAATHEESAEHAI